MPKQKTSTPTPPTTPTTEPQAAAPATAPEGSQTSRQAAQAAEQATASAARAETERERANGERQASEAWLHVELNRVWLLAERCLRELQKAQLRRQPNDPLMAEVEGMLAARRSARGGAAGDPSDEAGLARALQESEEKIGPLRQAAPIGQLVESLSLRRLELDALVIAMAPHIDAPLADLFAILRGSPARRGVDLALIAQLFRLRRNERVELLDVVDPERPLLMWRLIQIMSPESVEGYGSVNYRAIQPTFDMLSVLCARSDLSPELQRSAMLRTAPARLDDLVLDEPLGERVRLMCEAARQAQAEKKLMHMPWVMLWGPHGAGKTEIASRIAAYAGRPLLTFSPLVPDKTQLDDLLRRAQREALLRGAMLFIGPIPMEMIADNGRELARRLVAYPGMIFLAVETMQIPRFEIRGPLQELEVYLPSEPSREQLWERSLPQADRTPDLQLGNLVRGFRLTPGEIFETAREAQAIAHSQNRLIDNQDLRQGVDRRLRNELKDLARRITATARWEDLVLPDDDMERIREFISRKLYEDKVYREWGFGERVVYGKGMIALFSGPPGTGKTMLASLVGKVLDLDVYQVDIAQVVSKWVGETEKQLSKVFDLAERAQAVLLFDEADSLFARRTEVQSANDRYGNLAVNYLLQRLEAYTGVACLTTNKDALVDEGLQRRLSLHLRLSIPEPPERERLWRTFLPAKAPGSGSFDFRAIANEYEITGGYIKNASIRAAFIAASQDSTITMDLLRKAAALEMEDMGRIVARRAASARNGAGGMPIFAPKQQTRRVVDFVDG